MPPFPTPCKGKSKSQPFAHTFALTGRRRLYTDTQGVALGSGLAALSGRSRRTFFATYPSPSLCSRSEGRSPEAQHCSSLCSQSEGDEYCGGQTRLKIQQGHASERWPYSLRVRGPHFASKVSYNAGAATDDYAGQRPYKGRIFRVGGNGILKDCRAAHAAPVRGSYLG